MEIYLEDGLLEGQTVLLLKDADSDAEWIPYGPISVKYFRTDRTTDDGKAIYTEVPSKVNQE